jgi:hypothetical protein
MKITEYYSRVEAYSKNKDIRIGQALFNVLVAAHPKLAEAVRASALDPFHANSWEDRRVIAFIDFIEDNW